MRPKPELTSVVQQGQISRLQTSDSGESLALLKGFELQQRERLQKLQAELDSLIGLHSVKGVLGEIQAFALIQKYRAALQLACEPVVLHTVFTGNPHEIVNYWVFPIEIPSNIYGRNRKGKYPALGVAF